MNAIETPDLVETSPLLLTESAGNLIDYAYETANIGFGVNYSGYDWTNTSWTDLLKIRDALQYTDLTGRQKEGLLFLLNNFQALSAGKNRISRSSIKSWRIHMQATFADRFAFEIKTA
ncbi:MAG: hypothetical protein P4L53_04205 [Candidatus Obscuribacterales bacterium]|nr:hypothetical protein [Candidatus Obscuribacterales bacterium]